MSSGLVDAGREQGCEDAPVRESCKCSLNGGGGGLRLYWVLTGCDGEGDKAKQMPKPERPVNQLIAGKCQFWRGLETYTPDLNSSCVGRT